MISLKNYFQRSQQTTQTNQPRSKN